MPRIYTSIGDLAQAIKALPDGMEVACFVPDDSQGHSVRIEGVNSREEIFWLRAYKQELPDFSDPLHTEDHYNGDNLIEREAVLSLTEDQLKRLIDSQILDRDILVKLEEALRRCE